MYKLGSWSWPPELRGKLLATLGAPVSSLHFETMIEETLDALAVHCARHIDLDALLEIVRRKRDWNDGAARKHGLFSGLAFPHFSGPANLNRPLNRHA